MKGSEGGGPVGEKLVVQGERAQGGETEGDFQVLLPPQIPLSQRGGEGTVGGKARDERLGPEGEKVPREGEGEEGQGPPEGDPSLPLSDKEGQGGGFTRPVRGKAGKLLKVNSHGRSRMPWWSLPSLSPRR